MPTENTKIRLAKETDLESIYHLTCELEETKLPFDQFQDIFIDCIHSKEDSVFVLYDTEVLGYLHMKTSRHLHHAAWISEIQELIIRKEYRGRGFGKKLLEQAVKEAGKKGAVQVELTSNFVRKEAHAFYESAGFCRTSCKFVLETGPLLSYSPV